MSTYITAGPFNSDDIEARLELVQKQIIQAKKDSDVMRHLHKLQEHENLRNRLRALKKK